MKVYFAGNPGAGFMSRERRWVQAGARKRLVSYAPQFRDIVEKEQMLLYKEMEREAKARDAHR